MLRYWRRIGVKVHLPTSDHTGEWNGDFTSNSNPPVNIIVSHQLSVWWLSVCVFCWAQWLWRPETLLFEHPPLGSDFLLYVLDHARVSTSIDHSVIFG